MIYGLMIYGLMIYGLMIHWTLLAALIIIQRNQDKLGVVIRLV